ncbi:MAG TPA: tripartite tricarboxylate transporter permease [Thermodesulfobacteriota bacterium]|nr:tripartite tricarboxylate transporter permease [Thermodesulfobacteriota bacterium]
MGFSWEYLLQGFMTALSLQNLFWALVGCFIGTLVGVLPGIGPASGIAILLPLTTVLPPTSAIIMMAAIYYGAMYGGSTTAIVVNIPGEASSVPTAIDGYEMAKQGKAGPALGISAIASFVAGTLGIIGLTFFAPLLANFAVVFGPPEYFALMFMALTLIISLSGRALLKGVISMALGLITSLIGQDPLTGATRLTFGFPKLLAGIDFISVIVGLFAISEVMINVEQRVTAISQKIGNWMPTWADIKQCLGTMFRCTGVGFLLGLLPGVTPSVTTFVAYDLEKRISKHPERFGHGAIEGVAAPEGANNATSTAGFVPLFSFGLPTAPSMAVLLGGLMMYGLQPGPMLFKQNPEFVWAVIASMYIGNVMLIVLNLPLVGMWARICVIPFYILGPLIVFFSVLGTYSIRFQAFDVWVMLIFGLIGYFMRKLGFPVAPMVLATVIAQMMETSLGQSLLISQGSLLVFFTRPISAVFMGLAFLSIGRGIWIQVRSKAPEVAIEEAD